MKPQEVLRKIGNIISELNEQHQYLQAEEGHLNSLELELFVANAHFLTEHAEILRKISNTPPQIKELIAHIPEVRLTEKQESTPVAYETVQEEPEIMVTQPVSEPEEVKPLQEAKPVELPPVAAPIAGYKIEEVLHKPHTIINEPDVTESGPQVITPPKVEVPTPEPEMAAPVTEPVPAVDLGGKQDTYSYVRQAPEPVEEHSFSISSGRTAEEPVAPVPGISALGSTPQAEPPKPAPAAATLAQSDAKKEEPPVLTLNQRLSAQRQGSTPQVATVASGSFKPVTDLKSAVSLNDKLVFVRDLFNGYNLAYSEAIELLNRCKTFDEADRLLKANYVTKNNWAAKQATADKFYALLQRRFAS